MQSKRQFLASAGAAAGILSLEGTSAMATKTNGVRDLMAAQVEGGKLPGAAWLIARGDDVVAEAIGKSAIGGGTPMRRDTIFRIASMTKAVTAAAVMMLVEEGKLSLDAPAEKWLPELANRRALKRIDGPIYDTVPAVRAITVRDLLTFTFGFGLLFDPTLPIQKEIDRLQLVNGAPVPMTPWDPDAWMKRFGMLPLMHQPGEQWMYNTGSLIQGVLIRRASGTAFETFLAERIFAPLGMKDTGFFVPKEKLDRFAGCGVFTDPATHKPSRMDEDGAASAYGAPPVFPSGAGGLVSTLDDYHAFAHMLLKGGMHGGKRLLSEASVADMTRDHLTAAQKKASSFFPGFFDTHGWGYGVSIIYAPDGTTHYGWDGGFGTSFVNDSKRDLTAIVMTQSSDFLFDGSLDAFWRAVFVA